MSWPSAGRMRLAADTCAGFTPSTLIDNNLFESEVIYASVAIVRGEQNAMGPRPVLPCRVYARPLMLHNGGRRIERPIVVGKVMN